MADAGGTWTVKRVLEWTTGFFQRKGLDSPRLSAELLLAHVLEYPRIKLYTDYERPLTETQLKDYRALVQRASEEEPIAYLTGKGHFFNLEFLVTRDVLIPRPDTETVVENVLQLVRHDPGLSSARVLDLCTGSGCIAAAIAHHLKSAVIFATDISEAAVAVARENMKRLKLAERVVVEAGDLYEPISRQVDVQPYDLIVSNPPYIPSGNIAELDRSVRDYEPTIALDGGIDGLEIHRRILAGAGERVRAGGYVFLEIQFDQGTAAREMAGQYEAFEEAKILKDHAGHDRVLGVKRRA